MKEILKKNECPEVPIWLIEPMQLVENGRSSFGQVPRHILELLTLYRRSKGGCSQSAKKLAMRYESGDMPSGPDLGLAAAWYSYAVDLGSSSSALRLAEMLAWPEYEGDIEASMKMAQCGLDLILKSKYIDTKKWHKAAAASLFLLARNPNNDSLALIEDLLGQSKFSSHPDFPHIASALRKARCQAGDVQLSLKVAKSKITEDGGFKVGIYKSLEHPLPLVPVASDPDAIRKILDLEFPWFGKVNKMIYQQMVAAQYRAKPAFHLRPLLIAGMPGVGKTSWVKRLAELCDIPFNTVMAGGGADSMFLRGTPRGWSSARPGAVIQTIASEGVGNPLFLVDELEKASNDNRNGRIWDVLLQMLEPASSMSYLDECLGVSCDLSWVSWIATVNTLSTLPKPLLDRFTIVLVEPPTENHFMSIVEGAVGSFAKELGIDPRMLPILDGAELAILRLCKSPREVNRTVQIIVEQNLVKMHHENKH